jgi:hypothetical protein
MKTHEETILSSIRDIQSEIKNDSRKFVRLIQFLNYAPHFDFEINYVDQISYRGVGFRFQDFYDSKITTITNLR